MTNVKKIKTLLANAFLLGVIFVFFGFAPKVFANTCTAAAGGGNWNSAGTWTGCNSTFPQTNDDVVLNSSSGNVAVNVGTANLKSLTMTGYTGTLSGASTITVVGGSGTNNVIFDGIISWTGTLTLNLSGNINLTTNGKLLTAITLSGGASTVTLQDNLSFTAAKTDALTIGSPLLNMNGKTISGNSAVNRLFVTSSVLGTQRTVTRASGTFANVDFRDIDLESAYDCSTIVGLCGDAGGNSGDFIFTPSQTQTSSGSSSFTWSTHAWTSRMPLPQDDVVINNNFTTGQTITLDVPRAGRTIDMSGATWTGTAPAFSATVATTFYGSVIFASGMSMVSNGNQAFTAEGRGNFVFNTAGTTIQPTLTVAMIGGTLTFQSNFTDARGLTLTNGTLNANGFNVTATAFTNNSGSARTLNMGSGIWTLNSTGSVWAAATSGLTFNAGSSTIVISNNSATAKTFAGAGLTYNNINFSGDNITVTGSNTFLGTVTVGKANKTTGLVLTAGTTQTIGDLQTDSDASNKAIFKSGTASSAATISKSSGTVCVDYLNITDITGTGGATWNVGANSTLLRTTNLNNANCPVAASISSFSALPASTTPSGSSTLAWVVAGTPAPNLSINHGVGDVTGLSSIDVFPSTTTIYTLTAGNSGGTTTAQTTITVIPSPLISNIATSSITTASATISWITDIAANSQVQYGTTTSYGSSTLDSTQTTSHSITLSGLIQSLLYHFKVLSATILGGFAQSLDNTFTTATPVPDTSPPSTPTNLTASAMSASRIRLDWSASTDNTAVTGYKIFRDGVQVATTTASTTYSNTGLNAQTQYSYNVSAFDAAGNISQQSATSSTTTLATGGAEVTLNGETYTLKDHPRVFFDGPTGSLTLANGPGQGVGKAVNSNPAYQGLLDKVGQLTPNYTQPWSDNVGYPLSRFTGAALLWWAQGADPADPNGYLAEAKYGVNHVEDLIYSSAACDERTSYCSGRGADIDYTSLFIAPIMQTYSIVRSQLTTEERRAFANKILNDNSQDHNGLGLAGAPDSMCTRPSGGGIGSNDLNTGTGTVTFSTSGAGATTTMTGVGTAFTTQTPVGTVILGPTGGIVAKVISVSSDSSAVVVSVSKLTNSSFRYSSSWDTNTQTDCGIVWLVKHHSMAPRLDPARRSTYPNDYPVGGGSGVTTVSPSQVEHNLTLTKLYGYTTIGFALADDDERAATLLQQTYDFYYNYVMPWKLSQDDGLSSCGPSYGLSRCSPFISGIAIMFRNSVINGPDLVGSQTYGLSRQVPYHMYMMLPDQNFANQIWDNPYALAGTGFGPYTLPQSLYLNINPLESEWAQDFLQKHDFSAGKWEQNSGGFLPREFIFYDPSFPAVDYTTAPTQYAFRHSDYSSCVRLGFSCYATTTIEMGITKSDWTTGASAVLLQGGYNSLGSDHLEAIDFGSYHIYRKGQLLAGTGAGNGNFNGDRANDNIIALNGGNMSTVGYAPLVRWAGNDPYGDSQSRFAYGMYNLSNVYAAAMNATGIYRHVIHFKKPGSQDYIVSFDDVTTSSGNEKKAFFHFWKNSGANTITFDSSNFSVSDLNPSNAILNTKFLPTAGASTVVLGRDSSNGSYTGQAYPNTYRVYVCSSIDGTTCNASSTHGEWLAIHMPSTDTSAVMPTTEQPLCSGVGGNCTAVQIEDSSSPKVAVFGKQAALMTGTNFTTTHSGTAQYVIAGLSAGTYNVARNGSPLLANASVSSADNSLYFESASGDIQITQTSSTPAPVISSFIASPLTISNGQSSVLSWMVSNASSTWIDNSVGSMTQVSSGSIEVNPASSTTYMLTAMGPGGTASSTVTITVSSSSTPVISNIASIPSANSATITWNTSVAADTQVEYGLSSTYTASSTLDATLLTSHTVNLSGLSPLTSYHFRVLSSNGLLAASSDQTFTTTSAGQPTASDLNISGTAAVGQSIAANYTFTDPNGKTESGTALQWFNSPSSNGTYSSVSGAVSSSYLLTNTDIGKYFKFEVIAASESGTGTPTLSGASEQIQSSAAPTANSVSISGTLVEGNTLTGNYTYDQIDNVAEGLSAYQWLSSDSSGGNFSPITGANAVTYALSPSDVGKYIKFEVMPTAIFPPPTGAVVESSASGPIASTSLPVASVVSIGGTFAVGNLITGTYAYSDSNNNPESSSTFRWLRSASANGSYSAIPGAQGQNYSLVAADIGQYIRFEVTPVSSAASGVSVQSNPSTQIESSGVPLAANLSVSGTTAVGQTLTGNYNYSQSDNVPEGATLFRWLESLAPTGSFAAILGASNQTYALTASNAGKFLKFEVTPVAIFPPGSGEATLSSVTSQINGSGPPVVSDVAISGNFAAGRILTGSYTYFHPDGIAEGTSTFRWLSSDSASGTFNSILSAVDLNYTLSSNDVGKFIKFEVTPVSVFPPTTGSPELSGVSAQIQSLASTSTPTISGISSSPSANSAAITWTTSVPSDSEVEYGLTPSYTASSVLDSSLVTSHSVNLTGLNPLTSYHFRVLSSNGLLATSSDQTFITTSAGPPTASGLNISGTAVAGQNLTADYSFTDPNGKTEFGTAFQWFSSPSSNGTYSSVNGATNSSYLLTTGDIGKYFKFQVTPASESGTGTPALSGASEQIQSSSPPIASGVSISGSTTAGQILMGNYTYFQSDNVPEGVSLFRWLEASGASSTFAEIFGATNQTYTLTSGDVGKFLKFEVTPLAVFPPSFGQAVLSSATTQINGAGAEGGSGGISVNSGGGSSAAGIVTTSPSISRPSSSLVFTPSPISLNYFSVPTSSDFASNARVIKLVDHMGTFYLIINNQKFGIADAGILFSYGLDFKDAMVASEADIALAVGPLLPPGDSYLVKTKDNPTIYDIAQGQRHGFTSARVFSSLGFKFSSVLTVTAPELDKLALGTLISSSNTAHLVGADIISQGTVYYLGSDNKRHPYASLDVYNSWHRDNDFSNVVPANSFDMELQVGEPVVSRMEQ